MYPLDCDFFTTKYPELKAFLDEKRPSTLSDLARGLDETYPDNEVQLIKTLEIVLTFGTEDQIRSYLETYPEDKKPSLLPYLPNLLTRPETIIRELLDSTIFPALYSSGQLSKVLQHAISTYPQEAIERLSKNLRSICDDDLVIGIFINAITAQKQIYTDFQNSIKYMIKYFSSPKDTIKTEQYPQHPLFFHLSPEDIDMLRYPNFTEKALQSDAYLLQRLCLSRILAMMRPDSIQEHPSLNAFIHHLDTSEPLNDLVHDLDPSYELKIQPHNAPEPKIYAFYTEEIIAYFGSDDHFVAYASVKNIPMETFYLKLLPLILAGTSGQIKPIQNLLEKYPLTALFIEEIGRMSTYQERLIPHLDDPTLGLLEHHVFSFFPILPLERQKYQRTVENALAQLKNIFHLFKETKTIYLNPASGPCPLDENILCRLKEIAAGTHVSCLNEDIPTPRPPDAFYQADDEGAGLLRPLASQ